MHHHAHGAETKNSSETDVGQGWLAKMHVLKENMIDNYAHVLRFGARRHIRRTIATLVPCMMMCSDT